MELYAVKYAINFKYATYSTIFRGNECNELVPDFVFAYYIAKYNGKILLFDTGFKSLETAKGYETTFIDVTEEIKVVFDPQSVDTIFITHAHFDHTDNLDLYPNTEIIISRASYDTVLTQYQDENMRRILQSDQVRKIEDEFLYDDKFRFKVIGGHTEGSSVVYFEVEDQQYVIAGDECYLIENVEKNIPNGNVYDPLTNEKFIADAHDRRLIVLPFHDNQIFERYDKVSENIVRIL